MPDFLAHDYENLAGAFSNGSMSPSFLGGREEPQHSVYWRALAMYQLDQLADLQNRIRLEMSPRRPYYL